mmetsp:Transcript_28274/g.72707  ORF Transcript_28274/g.72707 Transcript_28274/m.72707 type:complete len:225 (-) Transcript_28274:206-880(-)
MEAIAWQGTGGLSCQPACAGPPPVRDDRVDESRQDGGVDEVAQELAALGDGSAHNGGGSGGEGPLEHPGRVVAAAGDDVPGSADELAAVLSVRERVPNEIPEYGADARIQYILEQDILGVFRADAAGLQQREAALHKEDEEGPEEQPEDGVVGRHLLHVSLSAIQRLHAFVVSHLGRLMLDKCRSGRVSTTKKRRQAEKVDREEAMLDCGSECSRRHPINVIYP